MAGQRKIRVAEEAERKMAGSVYSKNIRRTILGSFGRYMAILAIIALGVGFFAGIKNTKDSMMKTCDQYVAKYRLFDYRVLSSYGFTQEDEAAFEAMAEVKAAEGAVSCDFFSADRKGNSIIVRAHSVTEDVNQLDLIEGRMPEKAGECVADDHFYTAGDIGKTIQVTAENDETVRDALTCDAYTIVGIVKSPYYLMKTDRGTTSLGDGSVTAYVYIPRTGFTAEYFTEMFLICEEQGFIFSDAYEKNIKACEKPVTETAEARVQLRHDEIVAEAQQKIDEGEQELADGKNALNREKSSAYAKLGETKDTLDAKRRELAAGKDTLAEQKASLAVQRSQTADVLSGINAMLAEANASGTATQEEIEALQGQAAYAQELLQQIDDGLAQIAGEEQRIAEGEAQLNSGYDAYYSGKAKADQAFSSAEAELAQGEAELAGARAELQDLATAEIFLQTRDDNAGFNSFESNADIVDSIAKVFPVFFFLIAALVCSTTMSRMIEEERTQIGALRALGYTSARIMAKYMVYSGSAAVIGCVAGFFAGSRYFPLAIWIAYGMMFGFAPLAVYFSWPLAVISLAVSMLCSMGVTYLACRGQLKNMPAAILRPKAPRAGKRIVLEYIGFIWNHLSFLHKVTARNILRYKKRMIMMVLGIGGCTALVLAGFGIDDSIAGIGKQQYTSVERYDMAVAFSEGVDESKRVDFETQYKDVVKSTAILQQASVNVRHGDAVKSCNLVITDDENITKAVNFQSGKSKVPYPAEGEAIINDKMAEILGVQVGDTVEVEYDETKRVTLTVSGVYKNYVSNYLFISDKTYETILGKGYEPSLMYVTFSKGNDVHRMAEKINGFDGVIGISINDDIKAHVDDMMVSLNYIIILVICCAGALAFIVLFNLSNINITEREREIATVEVLGFYPRELGAYVFRENFVLVILGIAAGLPAGVALHQFIMGRISVDIVSFNEVVEPASYLYTVITVICFALIVDIIMRRKLRRINMAEALKSIE